MTTQLNSTQRLAKLGTIFLVALSIAACGGGGGGSPAPAGSVSQVTPTPVTPTTPPGTTTGPVTPPTTYQVICPNTNPVIVRTSLLNATDYTVCPPPVAVTPVVTWAAAKLANPPVATDTKYYISNSTSGGQVVNCNLASLPCFFANIANGTIKIIQTPVKMVGNPDPVEAARDIVFAFYREGNSGATAFCSKMLYADTGLPVFGLSQDSLSSFGCSTRDEFIVGTPDGVIVYNPTISVYLPDIGERCGEWFWRQTTLQWTARAVSAATCTALVARP